MKVPNWQPMEKSAKAGRWYARNADGEEAWTWHDGNEWVRECWRETEDRQEYHIEEWWSPTEYRADA